MQTISATSLLGCEVALPHMHREINCMCKDVLRALNHRTLFALDAIMTIWCQADNQNQIATAQTECVVSLLGLKHGILVMGRP